MNQPNLNEKAFLDIKKEFTIRITLDKTEVGKEHFLTMIRAAVGNILDGPKYLVAIQNMLAEDFDKFIRECKINAIALKDEIEGLMTNLLVSEGPPMGHTCLSEWLEKHAASAGVKYASDLKRHYH